jgi:hypothetical protein
MEPLPKSALDSAPYSEQENSAMNLDKMQSQPSKPDIHVGMFNFPQRGILKNEFPYR